MRTAWTSLAALASPLPGEAAVSDTTGRGSAWIDSVTINQFPAFILNAALQSSAARLKGAYIVACRRRFVPT